MFKKQLIRYLRYFNIFIITSIVCLIVLLILVKVDKSFKVTGRIQSNDSGISLSPSKVCVKKYTVLDGEQVNENQIIGYYDITDAKEQYISVDQQFNSTQATLSQIKSNDLQNKEKIEALSEDIDGLNLKIKQQEENKSNAILEASQSLSDLKVQNDNFESENEKKEMTLKAKKEYSEEQYNNAVNDENSAKKLLDAGAISLQSYSTYELKVKETYSEFLSAQEELEKYYSDDPESQHISIQQKISYYDNLLNDLNNSKSSYDLEIESSKARLKDLDDIIAGYNEQNDSKEELYSNQINNYEDIAQSQLKELSQLESIINNPEIRASQNGIIRFSSDKKDQLNNNIVAENINYEKKEEMFNILNTNSIYVESEVSNKDFPYINVGDSVDIELDSYPYTEYGILKGEVKKLYIGTGENGQTAYKCTIDISSFNNNVNLVVGENTSSHIIAKDKIRLFQYLMEMMFK